MIYKTILQISITLKKYKVLLLLLNLSISNIIFAQLAGNYTIGVGGDFASFSAAADTLNSQGIAGTVILDVMSGTYIEQFELQEISGTSFFNTVTFQSQSGNASDVNITFELTSDTNNYIVKIVGAGYVTFQNLTMTAIGTSYGRIFDIKEIHNFVIANCVLNGIPTSSSSYQLAIIYNNLSSSNAHDITIRENTINNGSIGIWFNGAGDTPGTVVVNNMITNNGFKGIHLRNQSAVLVEGNIIDGDEEGIWINDCDNNLRIIKNQVSAKLFGIAVQHSDGGSGSERGLIANNFVHMPGDNFLGTQYGIYLTASRSQDVYHNSVNIYGSNTDSRSFYMYSTVATGLKIINNIFVNAAEGYAYYNDISHSNPLTASDYNDLYTTGNILAYWDGNRADLTALQTASMMDSNSVSADPEFISDIDLHATSDSVDGMATSLLVINDDIDGDPRDPYYPDIGADEFELSTVAIDDNDNNSGKNQIPLKYELYQNFPNPFNPVTQIRFALPKVSHVKIEVYNILGQRIAILLNSPKSAGYHIIDFDASQLSSGVYFYRINAGNNYQAVKKMLLIR